MASDLSSTAFKDLEGVAFSLIPCSSTGETLNASARDAFPDADGPLGLLYALGVDAWRLAHWQRHAPPGLPFLGLTGQLTQAEDQRWVRTSPSHHRTRRAQPHTGAICAPRGEHSYPPAPNPTP